MSPPNPRAARFCSSCRDVITIGHAAPERSPRTDGPPEQDDRPAVDTRDGLTGPDDGSFWRQPGVGAGASQDHRRRRRVPEIGVDQLTRSEVRAPDRRRGHARVRGRGRGTASLDGERRPSGKDRDGEHTNHGAADHGGPVPSSDTPGGSRERHAASADWNSGSLVPVDGRARGRTVRLARCCGDAVAEPLEQAADAAAARSARTATAVRKEWPSTSPSTARRLSTKPP